MAREVHDEMTLTIEALRVLKVTAPVSPIWTAGGPTAGERTPCSATRSCRTTTCITMATSASRSCSGQIKKCKVRRVGHLRCLNERYADAHQLGFLVPRDGLSTLDAGTDPVKLYVNSALVISCRCLTR